MATFFYLPSIDSKLIKFHFSYQALAYPTDGAVIWNKTATLVKMRRVAPTPEPNFELVHPMNTPVKTNVASSSRGCVTAFQTASVARMKLTANPIVK